jgi:hypothetical protein
MHNTTLTSALSAPATSIDEIDAEHDVEGFAFGDGFAGLGLRPRPFFYDDEAPKETVTFERASIPPIR